MTRQQRAEKWAENPIFKFAARLMMLMFSLIGTILLTIGTFWASEVYNGWRDMQAAQTELNKAISETNNALSLIQERALGRTATVDLRIGRIEQDISEIRDNQRRYLLAPPRARNDQP